VLGWMIDTHSLMIKLPAKYEAWIESGVVKSRPNKLTESIDSLGAELNHVAFLIPLARHFLTRLRDGRQDQAPSASKSRHSSMSP
jgi:hypothetical protein